MVRVVADAAGAESVQVFSPVSKLANPREVIHCDRDACPCASTVSASMSMSTHSPTPKGRLTDRTRVP